MSLEKNTGALRASTLLLLFLDSLFFFSKSLSRLITSRRFTLSLSALNPPPNIVTVDYLLTGRFER